MKNENTMVAIYSNHTEAEQAVKKLQASGIDMKNLSIVGKDYQLEEHLVGYYNTGDRMQQWGGVGAFWGALWGMLVGSAFFMIPGIGPILVAGSFVSAIVGALEGSLVLGSLGAFGGALASLGIPDNSIMEYETELKAGKFMLLVHGSEIDVQNAEEILDVRPLMHERT